MTKEERAAKWDAEFIKCKWHPKRKCNKSSYVNSTARQCWECKNSDPSRKDRYTRYNRSPKGQAREAWRIERKLHG